MSSYSLGKELTDLALLERATLTLQDQVAHLFVEARDDVYRYLLSLGLYPPQAQEGAQEVFLRLYATLKKGENIQNPRAWIIRVAHNIGLRLRARQHTQAPFESGSLLAGPLGTGGSPRDRRRMRSLPEERSYTLSSSSALAVGRYLSRMCRD